ncbi:MAG: hypothetical protein KBS59_00500, partial [Clostridiales bacterium]|nr:hypothetical protein [Clostridiales bacterium]
MKNTLRRVLTAVMAIAMVAVMVLCTACEKKPKYEVIEGDFTYLDSVSTLASNWNPHTYQTSDDSYPASFIRCGFYDFIFNDASHPIDGKDAFSGYKIIPCMAASDPVDVTEAVKAAHPEFGIPDSATKGYAYTIDLNKNAVWENGEAINADSYVYSMKRLLDPELLNYRATDYISGSFVIANGNKYYYQGTTAYADNGVGSAYTLADCTKNGDYYYTPDGDQLFFGVDYPLGWCGGDTLKAYVDEYGDAYFKMDTWDALVALVDENGLVPVTDET